MSNHTIAGLERIKDLVHHCITDYNEVNDAETVYALEEILEILDEKLSKTKGVTNAVL